MDGGDGLPQSSSHDRAVPNRFLRLAFSTAAGGVHSRVGAASFVTSCGMSAKNGLPSASCTASEPPPHDEHAGQTVKKPKKDERQTPLF
jgi:hypothetical protein